MGAAEHQGIDAVFPDLRKVPLGNHLGYLPFCPAFFNERYEKRARNAEDLYSVVDRLYSPLV